MTSSAKKREEHSVTEVVSLFNSPTRLLPSEDTLVVPAGLIYILRLNFLFPPSPKFAFDVGRLFAPNRFSQVASKVVAPFTAILLFILFRVVLLVLFFHPHGNDVWVAVTDSSPTLSSFTSYAVHTKSHRVDLSVVCLLHPIVVSHVGLIL